MSFIAAANDVDDTVTLMPSISAGDLLIVVSGVHDESGTCSLNTPAGWTLQASRSAIGTYQSGSTRGGSPIYQDKQARIGIWTKIADGTESSTSLSFGFDGTEGSFALQYRPDSGSITAITPQDEEGTSGFGSGTLPSNDTINASDSGKTTIFVGGYHHDDSPSLTLSGPTFDYDQLVTGDTDTYGGAALQDPSTAVDVTVQYDDRPSSSNEGYVGCFIYLEIE
jgi:hypothetical protein